MAGTPMVARPRAGPATVRAGLQPADVMCPGSAGTPAAHRCGCRFGDAEPKHWTASCVNRCWWNLWRVRSADSAGGIMRKPALSRGQ